ncbi:MAG TPA: penicillin-binding transpeptidase domain-containing protein [Anaerolineales bacterium]|nr:penicillin-binding transpeptidase domain-containing protein [Anaerolineales bacterium]
MRLPNHAIPRLMGILAIAFALTALFTGYWSVIRSEQLQARDDNPRLQLADLRVQRGDILDRNNQLLATTNGNPDTFQRHYPVVEAAPVVGYYSFTYGSAGLEASYNAVLSGQVQHNFWSSFWQNDTLHLPNRGLAIRTTLDTRIQRTAVFALNGYKGGVIVVEPASGAILAMASSPSFDPNQLDATFEALIADADSPLVNRAAQGSYPAGNALAPLIHAVYLNFQQVVPDGLDAGSMATLLGNDSRLVTMLRDFGLLEAVDLGLLVNAPNPNAIAMVEAYPPQAFSSRGLLRYSPLQLVAIPAVIANEGVREPLQLVTHLGTEKGGFQTKPQAQSAISALPSSVANEVFRDPNSVFHLVQNGLAYEYATTDFRLPDDTQPIAWSIGFSADKRYAWVIVLEDEFAPSAEQVAALLLKGLP